MISNEENNGEIKRGRGRPKGAKNKPKTKAQRAKKLQKDFGLIKSDDLPLDDAKFLEIGYNVSTDKIINQEPIDKTFYYRGSKNVPIAGALYNFTEDMLLELKRCKEDILYFAENFFYVNTLDEGKKTIELYEAQRRVLRSLVDNRFVCLLSCRQSGKCFSAQTKIKIRHKTTGKIEEITAENLFERVDKKG